MSDIYTAAKVLLDALGDVTETGYDPERFDPLIDALRDAVANNGWRPMASMPKIGKPVLIFDGAKIHLTNEADGGDVAWQPLPPPPEAQP